MRYVKEWSGRTADPFWLRIAPFVFTLLVTLNVASNAWQAWRDHADTELAAARRVTVAAEVVGGRFSEWSSALSHVQSTVNLLISNRTLNNAALSQLADSYADELGKIGVVVYSADGTLAAQSGPLPALKEADNRLARLRNLAQAADDTSTFALIDTAAGPRMVFATAYRGAIGKAEAISLLVVPVDQQTIHQTVLHGVALPDKTTLLLRDGQKRPVVSLPQASAAQAQQWLDSADKAKAGPIGGTHYVTSSLDREERLGAYSDIYIHLTRETWRLDVGYATSTYQLSWWRSQQTNALGVAFALTLLVSGTWLLRMARSLRGQLRGALEQIVNMIMSIPTPVVALEPHTGEILFCNAGFRALFDLTDPSGEPISSLFVDSACWQRVQSGEADPREPVQMMTRQGVIDVQLKRTIVGGDASGTAAHNTLMLLSLTDVSEQQAQLRQLRSEANHDVLTGLANRRFFAQLAESAVAAAGQSGHPPVVLALDVDHFKQVNDRYGHAAGDLVLQTLARQLKATLRDVDLPARLGGEEFAVLISDTSFVQSQLIAERIRQAVADMAVVVSPELTIHVTISIGIAGHLPDEPDLEAAQQRADMALYDAKRRGRNQVRVYDDLEAAIVADAPTEDA